jgi:preprotein translocase subunit YajC
MAPLVVILILLAVGYVVLVRPARRRARSHEAMQDSVEVGDEIITAGGIHAVVRRADEKELEVEIAPTVVVRLDRRAVAAVAQYDSPEVQEDEAPPGVDQGAS